MALSQGSELGAYTIAGRLGGGGMGEVYRAWDGRLDRDVAIKVVRDEEVDPSAFRRLASEARAASALNHPGIITIHELGSSGDATFIVMELARGGSLRQMLERDRPLPVSRAVDILLQLATALAAAHAQGIVHRDLKPENVVFADDGRTAKIVDFGLARRLVHSAASHTAATEPLVPDDGRAYGTPAYMAPEQCRGEEASARSDQFALGTIAYEMLAGAHPFRRSASIETMAAILHQPPTPLPRRIPRPLRRVVARLLEKDPQRRYPDLRDAIAVLQKVPRPPQRRAIAAGVGAAVLLLAGALLYDDGTETAAESVPPPADSARVPSASIEEEYLRARYLREKFGEPDLRTIAALERIVERDPSFAPAWASLARSYANRFFYAEPVSEWEEKAFVAVEKALALDPDLADAYVARSTLLWTRAHGFPNRDALADAQRAIRLAPDSADGYGASALILMHTGIFDQAERDIAAARQLNPSDRNWIEREAYVYFLQWKCERALESFERLGAGISHARALDCAGRAREAEAMLAQIPPDSRSNYFFATQALLAARRGDRERALALIDEARRTDRGLGHLHHVEHSIGATYALLGDGPKAVEWLQRAAKNGFPSLATFELDPDLAGILHRPEYRELARHLAREEEELRRLLPLRHAAAQDGGR